MSNKSINKITGETVERYDWQRLRMLGWSFLCLSLIIRLIPKVVGDNVSETGTLPLLISLIGIISIALGYWYGEIQSRQL